MSNNTGGPAFPQAAWDSVAERFTQSGGISTRDYFAAKAMQGMLANPDLRQRIFESDQTWLQQSAWAIADAMLKAREGK